MYHALRYVLNILFRCSYFIDGIKTRANVPPENLSKIYNESFSRCDTVDGYGAWEALRNLLWRGQLDKRNVESGNRHRCWRDSVKWHNGIKTNIISINPSMETHNMGQCMDWWVEGWVPGGWMDWWMGGWMDGCRQGGGEGWMDGWVDACMG